MFQLNWANRHLWKPVQPLSDQRQSIGRKQIRSTLYMEWEEHCVECAMPDCYKICSLYTPRRDGNCARFTYGIVSNPEFTGHYNYGADIQFKKWGKLEADLSKSFPVPWVPRFWKRCYLILPNSVKNMIRRWLGKKYQQALFDEFVIECYSPSENSFTLFVEYFVKTNGLRNTLFRFSCTIHHGYNQVQIPAWQLSIKNLEGYLYLYPENADDEKRLIFTWLDLVKYRKSARPSRTTDKKIKCVAWDLDNTMWKGILSEGDQLVLNPTALHLVKELDKRGILQTIVSKNDFEPAWQMLQNQGIDQYFLYPAINWGQKSENLAAIANRLNIHLDTFAVIDDSIFEREEIKKALPIVRVYSDQQISNILTYPEFDAPVTEASALRRISYRQEAARENIKEKFSGDYEAFLISCAMELDFFVPQQETARLRCIELMQRTNQHNLSARRFTKEEFYQVCEGTKYLPIAIRCKDRFGDYGIIGFANLSFDRKVAVMEDFVLSCRVAQKKVEYVFIQALCQFLGQKGPGTLQAPFVKTSRNYPLRKALAELPFRIAYEDDHHMLMELTFDSQSPTSNLMRVQRNPSVDQRYDELCRS